MSALQNSTPDPPLLIGIAGGSGSGKTTIAERIAELLPECSLLALDCYYRDLSKLSPAERRQTNFDHPIALEQEAIVRDLRLLKHAGIVFAPIYDFNTHCRTSITKRIAPGKFIVVEGLFTLHWPELRDLLDVKVFVEAQDEICLLRRQRRDARERGRSPESVLHQYEATVRPMFEAFIAPTKQFADIVLQGAGDLDLSRKEILKIVQQRSHSRQSQ